MSIKTSFIFTGDSFITRRIPEGGYSGFGEISSLIKKYDVRFNNLEMTIHDKEGYPEALSGGTWAMAEPAVLDGLMEFGFNMYNTANNHSLDYSHGGLLGTIENLKKRGLIFAGTGENLYEAAKPAYLETADARVAMIGVSSSFSVNSPAGNQRGDMKGRPGLNPLNYKTVYHITEEHYRALENIADVTGINAAAMRSIRLGYKPPMPEGELNFAGKSFKLSDTIKEETIANAMDVERITDQIEEAKRQADYVIVSLHAHEFRDDDEAKPAKFVEEFARTCIDKGADAVVGHGPHELRGIEIYKGKPIFYSLGNFIFQTETVEYQPADAYENHGMPFATVGQYMDNRSQNGTRGYAVQPNIWFSVMAGMEIVDGKLKQIQLYPIDLHMEYPRSRRGFPTLKSDNSVLKYLEELSKPYGTEMKIMENMAVIDL
ncbi:CapA family protein [Tyzzerella sp. OttesenSCG-928-J15]|nr:CapA family protein [Tyzzerella sp. OttesenSCG-928-J15]